MRLKFNVVAALFFSVFTLPACEENEAAFQPCSIDADCDPAYACNFHPDSQIGRCAETCEEGCATGYECGGADGTECVASAEN